jgi:uncharacterized protein YutD
MNHQILSDFHRIADDLLVGQIRLVENFYEENQIYLSQQRIARLRANIDKERQKIAQWRMVLHRRREQEKMRKKQTSHSSDRS